MFVCYVRMLRLELRAFDLITCEREIQPLFRIRFIVIRLFGNFGRSCSYNILIRLR